jgi:hypothetical protein
MPHPSSILEQLRPEIERRIVVDRQPHSEVLQWLAGEGYACIPLTLKRRCKEWGISRRRVSAEPFVVSYIDGQFHTTLDDDVMIASQLKSRGYPITASTVQRIRLTNSWRHRQVTEEQKTE